MKYYGVYTNKDADLYAIRQTNIYETFLKSLTAVILGVRGSGLEITPFALRNALEEFLDRSDTCMNLLSEGDKIYPFEDCKDLYELYEKQSRFFFANRASFLAYLKLGTTNPFHSIDAHGAFGYLAQRKAEDIEWKVKSSNGSSLNAVRAFYLEHRNFAYQNLLDKVLMENNPDRNIYIINKDKKRINKLIAREIFPRTSAVRNAYFHFGSNNWIEVA